MTYPNRFVRTDAELNALFEEMSASAHATGRAVTYAISVPVDGEFEVTVKPDDTDVLSIVFQMGSQRTRGAHELLHNQPPWDPNWRENAIGEEEADRLQRLLWWERYRGSPHSRSR